MNKYNWSANKNNFSDIINNSLTSLILEISNDKKISKIKLKITNEWHKRITYSIGYMIDKSINSPDLECEELFNDTNKVIILDDELEVAEISE